MSEDTGRGVARERDRRWVDGVGLDREEEGGQVVEVGLVGSAAREGLGVPDDLGVPMRGAGTRISDAIEVRLGRGARRGVDSREEGSGRGEATRGGVFGVLDDEDTGAS